MKPETPKRGRRPSKEPTMELAEPGESIFTSTELSGLYSRVESASPEEFQKEFSKFVRKLIVRGLANVPLPKTIKELQALSDMLRKAEGLDAKDKGNGVAAGLVSVRRVVRNPVVVDADTTEADTTEADTTEADTTEADTTESDGDFEV